MPSDVALNPGKDVLTGMYTSSMLNVIRASLIIVGLMVQVQERAFV